MFEGPLRGEVGESRCLGGVEGGGWLLTCSLFGAEKRAPYPNRRQTGPTQSGTAILIHDGTTPVQRRTCFRAFFMHVHILRDMGHYPRAPGNCDGSAHPNANVRRARSPAKGAVTVCHTYCAAAYRCECECVLYSRGGGVGYINLKMPFVGNDLIVTSRTAVLQLIL